MANEQLHIGDIFTPLKWGKLIINRFGIFEQWMNGSDVFDPTMGNGQLLSALVETGIDKGYSIKQLPLSRLHGNELNTEHFHNAIKHFQETYGVDMKPTFTNNDLFKLSARAYDLILGNPPWINFVDLPQAYKEEIKPQFGAHGLIPDTKKLLLGGSRMDFATLVMQRSIGHFLKDHGQAYFFAPLSILLNDGANQAFRQFQSKGESFALKTIIDFGDTDVFNEVATRYGVMHFQRNESTTYPVSYEILKDKNWEFLKAQPFHDPLDPLSIHAPGETTIGQSIERVQVSKDQQPRQGINTCGANRIFFFTELEIINDNTVRVNHENMLPAAFVYPLIHSNNFEGDESEQKWALIPYQSNGKPLTSDQVAQFPLLHQYLNRHKSTLINRKGAMLQSWIKRDIWWAMLGVGPYSFQAYKIVWQAYGKHEFNPILVKGRWQANQSLQAYIPAKNKKDALRILKSLKQPEIQQYLASQKMGGTMSWAQPGKIKKILCIGDQ